MISFVENLKYNRLAHALPKTYKCHSCKKHLHELEAILLHKRIGDLKPGFYYCETCLKREKE